MTQDAGGSQDFSSAPQDSNQGSQQQAPSQETTQQGAAAQGSATGPGGGQIWYYALEGRPYGPYTYEQLTAFARAGYFHPADYVYAPHIVTWVRADSIAGLFGVAGASGGGFGPAGPAAPGTAYAAGGAWPQAQPAYAEYAGFWMRLVAVLIDWFVLLVPNCLLSAVVSRVIGVANGVPAMRWDFGANGPNLDFFAAMLPAWVANTLIQMAIGWLYFGLMESGPWQATVGKRALGLVVTDTSGRRISFARATGRYFASFISTMICYIGYIMGAFTERKQTLHDMIAETVVILGRTQ